VIFRYCPYSLLTRVLALGWVYAADLGPTHGVYSCLVEWPHAKRAPWPRA
jgi:hypothetical protein